MIVSTCRIGIATKQHRKEIRLQRHNNISIILMAWALCQSSIWAIILNKVILLSRIISGTPRQNRSCSSNSQVAYKIILVKIRSSFLRGRKIFFQMETIQWWWLLMPGYLLSHNSNQPMVSSHLCISTHLTIKYSLLKQANKKSINQIIASLTLTASCLNNLNIRAYINKQFLKSSQTEN